MVKTLHFALSFRIIDHFCHFPLQTEEHHHRLRLWTSFMSWLFHIWGQGPFERSPSRCVINRRVTTRSVDSPDRYSPGNFYWWQGLFHGDFEHCVIVFTCDFLFLFWKFIASAFDWKGYDVMRLLSSSKTIFSLDFFSLFNLEGCFQGLGFHCCFKSSRFASVPISQSITRMVF